MRHQLCIICCKKLFLLLIAGLTTPQNGFEENCYDRFKKIYNNLKNVLCFAVIFFFHFFVFPNMLKMCKIWFHGLRESRSRDKKVCFNACRCLRENFVISFGILHYASNCTLSQKFFVLNRECKIKEKNKSLKLSKDSIYSF